MPQISTVATYPHLDLIYTSLLSPFDIPVVLCHRAKVFPTRLTYCASLFFWGRRWTTQKAGEGRGYIGNNLVDPVEFLSKTDVTSTCIDAPTFLLSLYLCDFSYLIGGFLGVLPKAYIAEPFKGMMHRGRNKSARQRKGG